eukprot:359620-Chlamydomonas_euryale.AAC.5
MRRGETEPGVRSKFRKERERDKAMERGETQGSEKERRRAAAREVGRRKRSGTVPHAPHTAATPAVCHAQFSKS